jgi:predicted DNA-binding transcriptional regulator AlpA
MTERPDIYQFAENPVVAVPTDLGVVVVTKAGQIYREGLFDGMVPVAEVVDTPKVRELCGGVSRPTLLKWRKRRGFPEPLEAPASVSLWDAREVRAWLEEQKR